MYNTNGVYARRNEPLYSWVKYIPRETSSKIGVDLVIDDPRNFAN